jgi:hypothetical protein
MLFKRFFAPTWCVTAAGVISTAEVTVPVKRAVSVEL